MPVVHLVAVVTPPEVEGAAIPLMYALGLLAFLSFVILWGMRVTCVDWVTALLRWFAKHTPSLPFVGNIVGDLTNAIAAGIEDTVGASLSYAAGKFEQSAVFWFHGANSLVRYLGDSLAWDLAQVTHGFRVLTDSYIPWAVKEGRSVVYKGIDDLGSGFKHITRETEAQLARGIDATNREVQKLWEDIAGIKPAAKAAGAAGAIGATLPLAHGIDRVTQKLYDEIQSRLRSVEKEAAAAAVAGVIAHELERKLSFYKCSNTPKLSRIFCRFPSWLLDFLLGAAIEALTVVELCRIAQGAGVLVHEALPALELLLLAEGAVCLAGGASFPSAYVAGPHATKTVHLSVV